MGLFASLSTPFSSNHVSLLLLFCTYTRMSLVNDTFILKGTCVCVCVRDTLVLKINCVSAHICMPVRLCVCVSPSVHPSVFMFVNLWVCMCICSQPFFTPLWGGMKGTKTLPALDAAADILLHVDAGWGTLQSVAVSSWPVRLSVWRSSWSR